ncbi:MAG: hypothetical protein ACR2J7_03920 [Luteimonas sp.]
MTTHHDDAPGGGELDRIARALHAAGVAHVAPRTLMQLRARRTQPATGRALISGTRALGWSLAGACAAVFAVAIGLRMDLPSLAGDPAPVADAGTQVDNDDALEAYAALDQDPDFYLWLATTDVQPLAME